MRRRALVTGGAVRVGQAIALTPARAGMDVAMAAAVLFFATCPRYITGQVLKVDGGESVTS